MEIVLAAIVAILSPPLIALRWDGHKLARMREQAGIIQKHVTTLIDDVERLDDRVESLRKHFGQAEKDIDQISTSSRKISSKIDTIEKIQMETEDPVEEAIEPKGTPQIKLLVD